MQGSIEFSNVVFSYQDGRLALNNASFVVAPKTCTALVGESGGGKSTCLKLLFRFHDVTSGAVKVDGHDVREVTQHSLRQQVGVVPQDNVLFNETILYNLRYAKPAASLDEVRNACEAASIHDRIMAFPKGYSTVVGERGLRLSGGEKQRASACPQNSDEHPSHFHQRLLLDEATASLDSRTEQDIQQTLTRASKDRTTIIVA